MKRRPSLVVPSVDVRAAGDEELDHLEVVVDAGLGEKETEHLNEC